MARIGIYSDAHFSISSSILSRINGYKYSERLDTLVNSFKWMHKLFDDNHIDLIVNCGDLTDSDILQPEVNAALSEALSYNPGIKELYILGNHEIKNKDSTITSVSILQGYPNIELYNEISTYNLDDNTTLVLVPYLTDKDKYNKVYELLDSLSDKKSIYLFSHMSYIGENYNNYIETEGLDKINLTSNYPNLKYIFNGHIHNVKQDNIYYQVGSLIGNSFGDNYTEGYPRVLILDTDTNTVTSYDNPYAVLFYKMYANSIKDLNKKLSDIESNNDKCLRIEVPASIKDQVAEYLEQNRSTYGIKEYRLKSKYESTKVNTSELIESFRTYSSPYDALKKFTEVLDETPYPKEDMIGFLDKYIGG